MGEIGRRNMWETSVGIRAEEIYLWIKTSASTKGEARND